MTMKCGDEGGDAGGPMPATPCAPATSGGGRSSSMGPAHGGVKSGARGEAAPHRHGEAAPGDAWIRLKDRASLLSSTTGHSFSARCGGEPVKVFSLKIRTSRWVATLVGSRKLI